ncbi:MAG TPA: ABC transporter permease, partial [Stellaceae bacterium]
MAIAPADIVAPVAQRQWLREAVRRHPTVIAGSLLLLLMGAVALLAPYLGTVDPLQVAPVKRLRFPSELYWFGTDAYGRDVYSRTL